MSRTKFDKDCPGCRPVLLDPNTGQQLSNESPYVKALNKAWNDAPNSLKEAFHRVTCLNSRAYEDIRRVQDFFSNRVNAEYERSQQS